MLGEDGPRVWVKADQRTSSCEGDLVWSPEHAGVFCDVRTACLFQMLGGGVDTTLPAMLLLLCMFEGRFSMTFSA